MIWFSSVFAASLESVKKTGENINCRGRQFRTKNFYMKTQYCQTQVLENPDVNHNLASLSAIKRMRSKEHIEAKKAWVEDEAEFREISTNFVRGETLQFIKLSAKKRQLTLIGTSAL